MKNNRVPLVKKTEGDSYIVKARNRLIRRYNARRFSGGWRAVRDELEIKNVATVYNFAVHGTEPKNMVERTKLGLKKRCPTCKRPVKENGKIHTHKSTPGFMKAWKKLEKDFRYMIIVEGLIKHGIYTEAEWKTQMKPWSGLKK